LRPAAVAAGDVHMHRRHRRRLQDLLTAIRHGCMLQSAGARLFPNGERHLRPLATLARLYPAELLAASVAIAERCQFDLGQLRYHTRPSSCRQGRVPARTCVR